LSTHAKLFCNKIDIMGLRGDQMNDLPPGGVRYGLINVSSGFHNMQVLACKYMCKYSLAQKKPYKFENENEFNLRG